MIVGMVEGVEEWKKRELGIKKWWTKQQGVRQRGRRRL
jgi:hypothetical protein